jgi:hypothetical protein
MVKTRRDDQEEKDIKKALRRSLKKPKLSNVEEVLGKLEEGEIEELEEKEELEEALRVSTQEQQEEEQQEARAIQASLLDFFNPKRRSLIAEKEEKWDEAATVYYCCPGCDGVFALNRNKVANACNRYAHEKQAGGCGLNLCLCCGFQSFNPDEVYRHLHNDCITTYCAGPGCLACDIKNCHGIQVPKEFSFLKRCK